MRKLLFLGVLFFSGVFLADARTNCDSQPKPALDCPTGYTMMCIPVGGDHWGCGKESNGIIVEATEAGTATGVKSVLQTQVKTIAPATGGTLQPAGGRTEFDSAEKKLNIGDLDGDGSAERVLPTVNKANEEQSSERVLPTVNKATGDENALERQIPKAAQTVLTVTNEGRDRLRVEVRGWDPAKKEEITARVAEEASADPDIKLVELSEDRVRINYATPAKLFGVIPTKINLNVEADSTGKVRVKFPWYRFLMKTNYGNVAGEVESVFQNNQTDLEFLKIQDTAARQNQMFQTISNVLKTKHDTVKNSINNIR